MVSRTSTFLYKMITCPIDVKDKKVVELWLQYCCTYTADVSLEKPVLHREKKGGIQQYETYYKQLDLYYQFSHRMQKVIDEDWLGDQRAKTETADHEVSDKGKADLHCQMQILWKAASTRLAIPGM